MSLNSNKNDLYKNGQYKIIKCIGEGGFGKVYLVRDLKVDNENENLNGQLNNDDSNYDDKFKALKVLTRNLIDSEDLLDAIEEINILKNHHDCPYIIKYFDCFKENFRACLVTSYCENGDLDYRIHSAIKENRYLEEDLIFKWTLQMLKGLDYLHSKKIIHRDIKPANIFLHKNSVKLGDLGLARSLDTLKKSMKFAGTMNYLSPELIEQSELSFSSDIWAIGCVLYELITLQKAFDGKSYYQIIKAIVEKDAKRIEIKNSCLELVLAKTLNKTPEHRLSANELIEVMTRSQ